VRFCQAKTARDANRGTLDMPPAANPSPRANRAALEQNPAAALKRQKIQPRAWNQRKLAAVKNHAYEHIEEGECGRIAGRPTGMERHSEMPSVSEAEPAASRTKCQPDLLSTARFHAHVAQPSPEKRKWNAAALTQ